MVSGRLRVGLIADTDPPRLKSNGNGLMLAAILFTICQASISSTPTIQKSRALIAVTTMHTAPVSPFDGVTIVTAHQIPSLTSLQFAVLLERSFAEKTNDDDDEASRPPKCKYLLEGRCHCHHSVHCSRSRLLSALLAQVHLDQLPKSAEPSLASILNLPDSFGFSDPSDESLLGSSTTQTATDDTPSSDTTAATTDISGGTTTTMAQTPSKASTMALMATLTGVPSPSVSTTTKASLSFQFPCPPTPTPFGIPNVAPVSKPFQSCSFGTFPKATSGFLDVPTTGCMDTSNLYGGTIQQPQKVKKARGKCRKGKRCA